MWKAIAQACARPLPLPGAEKNVEIVDYHQEHHAHGTLSQAPAKYCWKNS